VVEIARPSKRPWGLQASTAGRTSFPSMALRMAVGNEIWSAAAGCRTP